MISANKILELEVTALRKAIDDVEARLVVNTKGEIAPPASARQHKQNMRMNKAAANFEKYNRTKGVYATVEENFSKYNKR